MPGARRFGVTKTVDLSDFGDDMAGSYAVVVLASYQQVRDISSRGVEGMSNEDVTDLMFSVAKENFVSGKIRVLTDDGKSELVDMQPDDIGAASGIITRLYLTVMGVDGDPKDLSTATAESPTGESSTEPSASSNSTKTTSSMESPAG